MSNSEKLSLGTKLAYGAGDLGPAITTNLLTFFLLPFFTNVAGLSPGTAGSILALSKLWDAVNDPIVGILSDRTHTRWGRRRPWILLGAIPFGITFAAQWLVPFPDQPNALFWYYILVAVVFNSFYTVVNLPYTALTPELTQDYDERTQLNNVRFAFSIGGSLVSAILYPKVLTVLGGKGVCSEGESGVYGVYALSGILWALVSTLPLFWCGLGVKERYQSAENQVISLLEQFRIAFRNRAYVFLIGLYLCSWLALQSIATIIPYYVTFWMDLPTEWVGNVILAVQGTAFVMLFVWSQISTRLGKRAVFALGMILWVLAQVGLSLLQPGQWVGMLFLGILAGIGVSTAYLIPWSMIPDVIELDELETGQRREGVFYGFMVLLQKTGLAVGLYLVGSILDRSGFISSVPCQDVPTQPESALVAIRWMIGPLPAIVLGISLILVYLYPITRHRYTEILAQLQDRRTPTS
jgi:GPH family glycoside/pentoside/hexuronide:cation symporter